MDVTVNRFGGSGVCFGSLKGFVISGISGFKGLGFSLRSRV